MTARGPRGGRRDFPVTAFDGDSSLDMYLVRDALVNNALHCADEGGAPVHASWMAPKSSFFGGLTQSIAAAALSDGSIYWPITTLGPWSIPVFSDGRPYVLRVELYAASASGSACDFAVRVGQLADIGAAYGGSGGDGFAITGVTSTSPIKITSTNLITISPEIARASRATLATLDDTGGTPVSVTSYNLYARVWGRGSAGKAQDDARLYGWHFASYVGPT